MKTHIKVTMTVQRNIGSFILCVGTALLSVSSHAAISPRFFQEETVEAKQVQGVIPVSPMDAKWKGIQAKSFTVYPQKTVRLNDQNANASLDTLTPEKVEVKAAYSASELGIWVEWKDSTQTLFSRKESNSFGDSAAIELPLQFGQGKRLPYVGMGDEKSHVLVYMQRAAEEGVLQNEYVGAGFGSLTRAPKQLSKMKMQYDAATQKWTAVFVRPLVAGKSSLKQGLVPVAFAFWDGARSERGGNKYLSSWKFVSLSKPNAAYLKEVSYGYNAGDVGDAEKGKQIVSTTCAGCHHAGSTRTAPAAIAPDLSGIGGIATYAYLRDSLIKPSDVVVRNLNINRHYAKDGQPDQFKAYPNNEMYKWYIADEKGNKSSKMPPFSFFSAQDIANVIAYLKTLDGTQK